MVVAAACHHSADRYNAETEKVAAFARCDRLVKKLTSEKIQVASEKKRADKAEAREAKLKKDLETAKNEMAEAGEQLSSQHDRLQELEREVALARVERPSFEIAFAEQQKAIETTEVALRTEANTRALLQTPSAESMPQTEVAVVPEEVAPFEIVGRAEETTLIAGDTFATIVPPSAVRSPRIFIDLSAEVGEAILSVSTVEVPASGNEPNVEAVTDGTTQMTEE